MTLTNLDHIPIHLAMEAEVNSLAQGHLAGSGSTGQGIQASEEKQARVVCVPGKLRQRLCCRTKLFWKMVGRPRQEMRREKTSNVPHPHPLYLPCMCGGAQTHCHPFFAPADLFQVDFNHREAGWESTQ